MADDLNTETLSQATLLALSRRRDPAGVLSVYAGADARTDPGLRGTSIDIGNRLAELRRRIDAEGPADRARALNEGLRRLQPSIRCSSCSTRRGRPASCSPRRTRRGCWTGGWAS